MTSTPQSARLEGWSRLKVALVGDLALDAYWHLDVDCAEVSVETGVATSRVREQQYGLGGAANVTANLVSLGVGRVRVLGVRGADPYGAALVGLLAQLDVDVSGVQDLGPEWSTLVYAKPIRAGREESRFDFGTRAALPPAALDQLVIDLHSAARWADAVVVNQQVEGPFSQPSLVQAVNEVIAAHPNTLFLVDARDVAPDFRGAVLKVNASEAALHVEGKVPEDTLTLDQVRRLADKLTDETGRPVLITRGDRGIVASDGAALHVSLGIQITGPVDPVGAGDTVLATLAAVLASGQDLATAAELANVAASITVRKTHTTGTVTPAELLAALQDVDYVYDPELAENPTQARHLEGTEIELIGELPTAATISYAIFDHDGTLSTLRQGWEEVMEPMMVQAILGPSFGDADAPTYQRVRRDVLAFIDQTTGVQTLAQMKGLAEMVRRYGFVPEDQIKDEHGYKAVYNDELMKLVRVRLGKLERAELSRADFHIVGALAVLERLRDLGVVLYLASGTDHDDVVTEATALGFAEFFGDRIYGSTGDIAVEAKRVVLERIVRENGLRGENIVTFGDGPVEMRETRKRGGVAVGLCSDENRRFGFNPAKRGRLIRGGATVLVPDFSTVDSLLVALRLVPTDTEAQS